MKTDRRAVLFLSHGSPMHAIAASDAARAWSEFGEKSVRPRAVLMVSAHWDTGLAMLSGARAPETIHDFGGFPEELYRIRYPAPGAPELAERARILLKEAGIAAGIDGCRGLDHGAWVPLRHLYPEADVPVVQLSVQSGLGARQHWALGQALSPLRDEGVLIIGSGHMTHNLRDYLYSGEEGEPLEYVQAFRSWVLERLAPERANELLDWEGAPGARRAHPTPEHFLPLFVALGAAGARFVRRDLYSGFEGRALATDGFALIDP